MRRVIILMSLVAVSLAWSVPFYPVQRTPMRFTRYAPPPPPHRVPIPVHEPAEEYQPNRRPKRGHDDYNYDHDGHGGHDHTRGVTGPVHTFVKTDKNANYKWGVRHHVGNKYAS